MAGDGAGDGLAAPTVRLDIGITGHRSWHPVFAANRDAIAATLAALMDVLDRAAVDEAQSGEAAPPVVRLYSLLAYGADLMAVQAARERGWPVIAPLPFGRALNLAINAQPNSLADMQALLTDGEVQDAATAARAADIRESAGIVDLFELAEQDAAVCALYHDHLAAPEDEAAKSAFAALCSDRAAMAGRVMLEHCDLLIGIWDGETRGSIGGTRHSIEAALDLGVPVVWIDARNPRGWHLLHATEELAGLAVRPPAVADESGLRALLAASLRPSGQGWQAAFGREKWRGKSNPWFQAYRRIEKTFGEPGKQPFRRLTQHYEAPETVAAGSGAPLLAAAAALPGMDPELPPQIATGVLRPFAWADGVSSWLSDAYRGGMVASFFLSAFAIIGGIAYLPFASVDAKWGFAAFEFLLLAAIIAIFMTGKRRRWHERWFETRRVAEYFRHAPILLLLGAARSTGRWPRGADGNWPECYVRHALRAIALPQMQVTSPFLREALALMRDHHVEPQRRYHQGKAQLLQRAQHNLDRLSEFLFLLAVISVALFLAIKGGAVLGWLPSNWPHDSAKAFTFLGVLFPTLGGAFAGVHYFGDFERFAAISEISAEKLDDVATRINLLLAAPDSEIIYARVSVLAHAIDAIVVDEIENWQAVFGGKHITVPV
jgi:hypothetical protein